MFFFVEEMKNEEGRGGNQEGKYIFLWRRRKMRKIFGEGKYFFTTEKKNGEGKGGE